jgi:hypothetical protein
MTKMIAIRKVMLGEHHLSPDRAKHTLSDGQGTRAFPPFTALWIVHDPDDSGYYLMYGCENGQSTDTWHQSLEDALHQADWEFGVQPEEWTETNEPF